MEPFQNGKIINIICIFYDKDNKDKLYRKFSNYGVKYLNYKDDEYYKYNQCTDSFSLLSWDACKAYDEDSLTYRASKKEMTDTNGNKKGECDKIYIDDSHDTNERKKLYDYWVLTIVFSCFIFVLDIGLAIFGFLIFKDSNGTSGAVSIK